MSEELFRQRPMAERRIRLTGTVVASTPESARYFLWIIGAIGVAFILLMFFGEFTNRVQVRGVVVPSKGLVRVYAPDLSEVQTVYVKEGETVTKNKPLASLAQSLGVNKSGQGVTNQIALLRSQEAELLRQLDVAIQLGKATNSALADQRKNLELEIGSLNRQLAIYKRKSELAATDADRLAQLEREGAASLQQAENAKAVLFDRQLDAEKLREKIISQKQALRTIEAQIVSRQLDSDAAISDLTAKRLALSQQIQSLERTESLVLTSPIDGVVDDLSVQMGQRTRADRSLLAIIPRDSVLEAEFLVSSRAVGPIKPNQTVQLIFDAFPYQIYGTRRGVIRSVASVNADQVGMESRAAAEPVFRIRVALVNIDRLPLRSGMTVTGNVLLERRPLWRLAYSTLQPASP